MITNKELSTRMSSLHRHFPVPLSSSSSIHERVVREVTALTRGATRSQLLSYEPSSMATNVLRVLYCREELARPTWRRRRRARASRDCYERLLRAYLPERSEPVIRSILDVLDGEALWQRRRFCHEAIRLALAHGAAGTHVVDALWRAVEAHAPGTDAARAILAILYEILDTYDWPETQETVAVVERLLKTFHDSIVEDERTDEVDKSRENFKKGVELCVRNIVKHLPNNHLLVVVHRIGTWIVCQSVTDENILNFGTVLEFAAYMHRAGLYEKTLTPTLFPLLMQMIASRSEIVSHLGNRVVQSLVDRQNNRAAFDTPRLFFEDTYYNLRVGEYRPEDKHFLKIHREVLHDSLLKSVSAHCGSRMNLESTYRTICLIAIEVPCGFVAAAMVCLVMNMQDFILREKDLRGDVTFHVHATVIAITSLLCWIHRARVFYAYVNKIMMERAQWAPHLNPPLLMRYDFAIHHVRWEKPELFFVDWEVRYGLWKCFRLRDDEDRIVTSDPSSGNRVSKLLSTLLR